VLQAAPSVGSRLAVRPRPTLPQFDPTRTRVEFRTGHELSTQRAPMPGSRLARLVQWLAVTRRWWNRRRRRDEHTMQAKPSRSHAQPVYLPNLGRARRRVLLAEDDPDFRRLLAAHLSRHGFDVEVVSNGSELMRALTDLLIDGNSSFDILVSDVGMPVWSGLQVLNGLRCAGCSLPAVLITASEELEVALLAGELNARLLLKPFDLGELICTLESIELNPQRGPVPSYPPDWI